MSRSLFFIIFYLLSPTSQALATESNPPIERVLKDEEALFPILMENLNPIGRVRVANHTDHEDALIYLFADVPTLNEGIAAFKELMHIRPTNSALLIKALRTLLKTPKPISRTPQSIAKDFSEMLELAIQQNQIELLNTFIRQFLNFPKLRDLGLIELIPYFITNYEFIEFKKEWAGDCDADEDNMILEPLTHQLIDLAVKNNNFRFIEDLYVQIYLIGSKINDIAQFLGFQPELNLNWLSPTYNDVFLTTLFKKMALSGKYKSAPDAHPVDSDLLQDFILKEIIQLEESQSDEGASDRLTQIIAKNFKRHYPNEWELTPYGNPAAELLRAWLSDPEDHPNYDYNRARACILLVALNHRHSAIIRKFMYADFLFEQITHEYDDISSLFLYSQDAARLMGLSLGEIVPSDFNSLLPFENPAIQSTHSNQYFYSLNFGRQVIAAASQTYDPSRQKRSSHRTKRPNETHSSDELESSNGGTKRLKISRSSD